MSSAWPLSPHGLVDQGVSLLLNAYESIATVNLPGQTSPAKESELLVIFQGFSLGAIGS